MNSTELNDKASKIRCIICDVDGVLTNGAIIYDNSGMEYKNFNVKDGQIVKYLKNNHILIGVITGRDSKVVKYRCDELGFDFHYHGIKEKGLLLDDICDKFNIALEEIAYIGDDINDIPILTKIGMSVTPNDGHYTLTQFVDWRTNADGGSGVLREVADYILSAQNKYENILTSLIK